MSERFVDFIKQLIDPQVRALASQSGVETWATGTTEKLRELLVNSKEAEVIYEKHYGN